MVWLDRDKILKGIEERKGFTRYLADDFVPQVAEFIPHNGLRAAKDITVVIPTLDADRHGCFPQLLEDIKKQSLEDFQVLIVKGDRQQGRAINLGVALSEGEVIIILDDDIRLGHRDVFKNLVSTIKSDERIGMAGVSNLIPENASWLVRRVMREVPRRNSPLVKELTDSDLAEHPCCAFPKRVFKEIGGETELIPRGLDPYLRAELRKRGYRVVVIPDTWIHHLPPDRFLLLIKQFFRNGKHSAYCTKFYPQWAIELAEEHGKEFKERVSITHRAFRYLKRLLKVCFTLRWIYLLTLLCYLAGFGWGYMTLKRKMGRCQLWHAK